jgi:hypothetical protein
VDLLGSERRVLEQAFAQVSKISVRVSGGCDSLIYLHDVRALPGHLFICQSTKHFPGGVAAADRYDETAPIRHRRPGFRSDNLGSPTRDYLGIGKYLNLHNSVSDAMFFSSVVGFAQPPGGATFSSTSLGPQVPGSYS